MHARIPLRPLACGVMRQPAASRVLGCMQACSMRNSSSSPPERLFGAHSGLPRAECRANPCTALATTRRGGHCAHLQVPPQFLLQCIPSKAPADRHALTPCTPKHGVLHCSAAASCSAAAPGTEQQRTSAARPGWVVWLSLGSAYTFSIVHLGSVPQVGCLPSRVCMT